MVSMLEQAIVDAAALKEAAQRNAENIILDKYAAELREAVDSILDQGEEDPLTSLGGGMDTPAAEDPLAQNMPMAATDGEKLCPCPDEEEEIEINFDQLAQQMGGQEDGNELPGQMGELKPEEDDTMMQEAEDGITVPAQLGPELHMYHMNMGDPIYKVGSLAYAGKTVPVDLLDSAISNLESLKGRLQEPKEKAEVENLIGQLSNLLPQEAPEEEPNPMAPSMEGDYNQNMLEDVELTEELIGNMLETLEVEMQPVPHGHAGHATSSEREDAWDMQLAREQDTKVAEQIKDLEKALKESLESSKKLDEENKTLKLENNKVKGIALKASQKLSEINLDNAKLMYENRALKSDSLNERQKETIVEAMSKVGSVNEAKVVFESLMKTSQGSGAKVPDSLNEAISMGKGNLLALVKPTKITESINPQKERMQKLAGIKRNS